MISTGVNNKEYKNRVKLEFPALPENEGFARAVASAFTAMLDPTVEELTEIKTAVSEAVSNVVIHAYKKERENNAESNSVVMELFCDEAGKVVITVQDNGAGIDDIAQARSPLFTTGAAEERSGMGFTVMESFMDKVFVESEPGKGTKVTLIKSLDIYYGV